MMKITANFQFVNHFICLVEIIYWGSSVGLERRSDKPEIESSSLSLSTDKLKELGPNRSILGRRGTVRFGCCGEITVSMTHR